jgi:hypothetical protein
MEALGERIMAPKEQLKQQFAGGNLPPPHTRSFSGYKLVEDNPVAAAGGDCPPWSRALRADVIGKSLLCVVALD